MSSAVRDEIILQNPVCKVKKLKDTRELRARDTIHRALRWSNIDYEKELIHIRKTMSYDLENKPVENSPKTRTSMRNIPLNQNIINILEKQKQQTAVLNMERKIRALDDYVIKSPNNLPVRDIRRLNEAIH